MKKIVFLVATALLAVAISGPASAKLTGQYRTEFVKQKTKSCLAENKGGSDMDSSGLGRYCTCMAGRLADNMTNGQLISVALGTASEKKQVVAQIQQLSSSDHTICLRRLFKR